MTTIPVWVVTGASKGMGRQIAEAALRSGAAVAATSRNPRTLQEQLSPHDPDLLLAISMSFDEPGDIARAVQEVVDRFGRIDVLVNNAGYALLGAVEDFSRQEVQTNFGVNVFGLLEVTQQVLPVMRAQRSGHVINMASISANVTSPATGLYSATKAAVLMLTEALAYEAAPLGIRATAVCPGGVRTDFLDPSSSRVPEHRIDGYREVDAALRSLENLNHRQGGDPALVAQALLRLVAMDEPPTRLYLGSDALRAILGTCERVAESADRHRSLSLSING